ncbi:MAG: zinc ribbon domain-containing protein [Thermodesulfobacteriota bacterium]|jgi:putative FmdB family regulatory protein|nr:MAG: zinc ribbon domain-containing protein [Thermodesulfobacteriota bacterium]
MPIYEFICLECKNIFELLAVKKGDLLEIKCPSCDSDNLERAMSKIATTSGGNSGKKQTPVENRSCSSGTCSTITLPGHTK